MLLECQLDWIKIVDFLVIAKFMASPDNYATPSSYFVIATFLDLTINLLI